MENRAIIPTRPDLFLEKHNTALQNLTAILAVFVAVFSLSVHYLREDN